MNRFTKQKLKNRIIESANFSIILFLAVIVLFVLGIGTIASNNEENGRQTLQSALDKDIVHCYAVEGYYPPSLAYIEEHYGLTYDHSKYIVDYESVGANIMPTVTILEKNSK